MIIASLGFPCLGVCFYVVGLILERVCSLVIDGRLNAIEQTMSVTSDSSFAASDR